MRGKKSTKGLGKVVKKEQEQQEQALEQKQQLQKKEFGDKELKAVKNTIATIRALYFAKLPEAEQINRYGSPVLQNPPANIDAIENEQAKELAERIAKVREEKLADLSARVKSSAKRDKLVTSKGELDLERLSQLIQHVESELKEELLQSIIGEGTPDAKSFKTILAEKTQAVNTQITQLEQETQALSQSLTEKPLDAEAVIQHRDTITRIMGALDNTREDLKREHQQRSERKELPIQEIEENGLSELIRDIERAQKNVPSILAQTKEVLTSDAVATLRDILSQLDEKVKVASQAEKIDFKEIDRSLNTINKIVEKLKNDKSENATKLLAVAEATLQSYTQLREKAKQTEQPSSEALTELDALLDNISTESKEVNTEFTQKEATQLDELMKKEFEGLAAEANQTEETPSIEEMLREQKLTEADKAPINEEVTKRQRNHSRPVVEGKIKGPTLATEPAAPQAAEIKTTTPAATTVSPVVVPLSPKDKQDETPAEAAARTAGEEAKELSSLREHITDLRNKIDILPDDQVGPALADIETMQTRIESLEGKSAALTAGQIGGGMEEVSERKGSDTTVPLYNVPTKDGEDDSDLSTELSSLEEDKEEMESMRQSIKGLEGKIETQKNTILKKVGELPNKDIEQKLERLDMVMSNASNVQSTNYNLRNHEERFQNVLIDLQRLDQQLDSQLSQPSEPEKPSAFKAGLGKEGSIMSRLRFGYRTASSNMSREAQIYHAQECGEKRVLDLMTRNQSASQGQGQPQTAAESRQSWWGSMRAAVREGDVGYVFTLIGGGLGVVARDIRGVFTSSTAKALENERVKKIDACIAAVLQMKAEPTNSGRQKDLTKLLNNLESDRVRLLKSDPEVLQRFQNTYDTLNVNSVVPSILSDAIQRSGIQNGGTLLTQYEENKVRTHIRVLLADKEHPIDVASWSLEMNAQLEECLGAEKIDIKKVMQLGSYISAAMHVLNEKNPEQASQLSRQFEPTLEIYRKLVQLKEVGASETNIEGLSNCFNRAELVEKIDYAHGNFIKMKKVGATQEDYSKVASKSNIDEVTNLQVSVISTREGGLINQNPVAKAAKDFFDVFSTLVKDAKLLRESSKSDLFPNGITVPEYKSKLADLVLQKNTGQIDEETFNRSIEQLTVLTISGVERYLSARNDVFNTLLNEARSNAELVSSRFLTDQTDSTNVYAYGDIQRDLAAPIKAAQIYRSSVSLNALLDPKTRSEAVNETKTIITENEQCLVDLNAANSGMLENLAYVAPPEMKKYELAVMTQDIREHPENAVNGIVYLSEDGSYIVRDLQGVVQNGTLTDSGITPKNLADKVNDPIFRTKVLMATSRKGHTKPESSGYGQGVRATKYPRGKVSEEFKEQHPEVFSDTFVGEEGKAAKSRAGDLSKSEIEAIREKAKSQFAPDPKRPLTKEDLKAAGVKLSEPQIERIIGRSAELLAQSGNSQRQKILNEIKAMLNPEVLAKVRRSPEQIDLQINDMLDRMGRDIGLKSGAAISPPPLPPERQEQIDFKAKAAAAAAAGSEEMKMKVSDTTEAGPPPLPPERAEQIDHKAPAAKAAAGSEETKVADTAVTNKPWSIELATGQEVSPGLGAMMRVLKTLQDFNEKDMLISLLIIPGRSAVSSSGPKGDLQYDLNVVMTSPEYQHLSSDLKLRIERLNDLCERAEKSAKTTERDKAFLVLSQEITAAKKPNGLVPALASEIKVAIEKANQSTAAASPATPEPVVAKVAATAVAAVPPPLAQSVVNVKHELPGDLPPPPSAKAAISTASPPVAPPASTTPAEEKKSNATVSIDTDAFNKLAPEASAELDRLMGEGKKPADDRIPMINVDQIVPQKGRVPPMAKDALQVKVSTVETNIQSTDVSKALQNVLDTHNSALGAGKPREKMSFAQTDTMFKGTILGVEVSKKGDGPVIIAASAIPEKNKIIAEIVTKLPPEGKSKEVNVDAGHLSQKRLDGVVHALKSSNPSHTVNSRDKTADIEIKLKK